MARSLSSGTEAIETDVTNDGGDSRSTILAAAIEIISHEGAGALTVRSVAKAAGCSTTGVYTWFGGKNGLVDAIFIDGFQRFGQALTSTRKRSAPIEHVRALSLSYRSWALANPTHYMVMFGGAVPDHIPSEAAMVAARATFDQLVDAVAVASQHVTFASDPEQVAHHLWAGIHGYVSLQLAGMDRAHSEAERVRRYNFGLDALTRGVLLQ